MKPGVGGEARPDGIAEGDIPFGEEPRVAEAVDGVKVASLQVEERGDLVGGAAPAIREPELAGLGARLRGNAVGGEVDGGRPSFAAGAPSELYVSRMRLKRLDFNS